MFGFAEEWYCDTEYGAGPNGRPVPVCLAAVEWHSGRTIELWMDDLAGMATAPINVGEHALFIAYATAAEVSFFIEQGWRIPHNILDLWTEFIMVTNGVLKRPQGKTRLIDAQTYYKQEAIAFEEKAEMRDLALRIGAGGSYTMQDRAELQAYCMEDVQAMLRLVPAMREDLAKFHIREMLFRGRATIAQARIFNVGMPMDVAGLRAVADNREAICDRIVASGEAENHWGIFTEGHSLSYARYDAWREKEKIPIPRTDTDRPSKARKVLERLENRYPQLTPLRLCLGNLDALSSFEFEPSEDGRLRVYANPYGSDSLRNQPSAARFPFSWPKWFRYFLLPEEGYGLCYLDAAGQEFLFGARLSECRRMETDYETRDVHMAVGKALALIAPDVPDSARPPGRKKAKGVVYGSNYGQTKFGLREVLGRSLENADWVLTRYRRNYAPYYRWVQSLLNGLKLKRGTYFTRLGSPLWTGGKKPRQIMNHPLQTAGSDWLRVVMIAATESGLDVAATVHDAILIVAPLGRLSADIGKAELIMKAASIALYGAPVLVSKTEVRWPNRFVPDDDETAAATWGLVQRELESIREQNPSPATEVPLAVILEAARERPNAAPY
jgi:DNA polymerase-1